MTVADAFSGDCDLCAADKGVYDFGRVCCCARYVCSIPLKAMRQGWMERLKSRVDAGFFAQLEQAISVRWSNKKNNQGVGDGGS